jgi:hypothetical protein
MASSSAFSAALVVEDFLHAENDRDHDHLGVEIGVVEDIERRVQQLIVARVPLRGLLGDLQRLPDFGAGIGLPQPFAAQGRQQRVVGGNEVLIARRSVFDRHRQDLLIGSKRCDIGHGGSQGSVVTRPPDGV